jgi:hypothetical protein
MTWNIDLIKIYNFYLKHVSVLLIYNKIGECIQKFPNWVYNEINNNNNNKHSLRSNTKSYGGKTL